MRIGAHRAKEPQILGESGEIAFKRTLHLEIIRLSRFIANFAGQLPAAPRNGLTDVTSTVNSAQAPSRHTGDST